MAMWDDFRKALEEAKRALNVLNEELKYFEILHIIASKLETAASHQHLADAIRDFNELKKIKSIERFHASVRELHNKLNGVLPHLDENQRKQVEVHMERLKELEGMVFAEIDKELGHLLGAHERYTNWGEVNGRARQIKDQAADIIALEETLRGILEGVEVKAASHITPINYNWGGSWEDIMSTLQKILSSYIDDGQLIDKYLSLTKTIYYHVYVSEVDSRSQPLLSPFWLLYALTLPKVLADEDSKATEEYFGKDAKSIRIGFTMAILKFLSMALKVMKDPIYYDRADPGIIIYRKGDEPILYEKMYKYVNYAFQKINDPEFDGKVLATFKIFEGLVGRESGFNAWTFGGVEVINANDPNSETVSGTMLRYSLMLHFIEYIGRKKRYKYMIQEIIHISNL